ncbi:MAG: flagellar protein FlgN [Pseudomonadota bacterium]|nr:flagellar protein FlgN [Pseudomonadota bacterium]
MIPADSHASDPQALLVALEDEVRTLVELMGILDIEHVAIMDNDPERLEQAVVAKQKAITAHLGSRSNREALGLRDSLREQLETHPTLVNGLRDKALALVTELSDLALQSKNMNARNGKLIAGLKERTNTSLKVLRPEAASITLYGDSGSAENTMGSRLLGSA